MSPISIMAFLGCLAILASMIGRTADVFSPGRVFGFIWLLAIGLTDLKWSSLQHDWPLTGWILLLIGVGSFLLGVFCVYVCRLGAVPLSLESFRTNVRRSISVNQRLYGWLIAGLFLLYAASYAVNASIKGQ